MSASSKQNGFAQGFMDEVNRTGNVKSLVGAVGMPDKDDWRNIVEMISVYRKESVRRYGFDILTDCIATARREFAEFGGKYESRAPGFNLVNKDSNMRYHFELPGSFVRMIELAYPLMFKDKKHYHWFCRNFAELRIADRF